MGVNYLNKIDFKADVTFSQPIKVRHELSDGLGFALFFFWILGLAAVVALFAT